VVRLVGDGGAPHVLAPRLVRAHDRPRPPAIAAAVQRREALARLRRVPRLDPLDQPRVRILGLGFGWGFGLGLGLGLGIGFGLGLGLVIGLGFDPLDQPRVEGEGAHAVALELLAHLLK